MSPTTVTVDVNGEKVSFPVNEIVRINYDREPVELKVARRLADARRYGLALKRLDEIKLAEVSRDLISQDIAYYRAYSTARLALGGRGDKDTAIRMLRAFVSKHKNSYHYFAAAEGLGDLAVADRQYDMADTFYKEVAKAPWPAYKLRATALEGWSLQARKKYAEALEKYEQVIGASKDIPGAEEPKRRAALGKMDILVATSSYLRKPAELHGSATSYYGDGGCCCWDFDVWQVWGMFANITYIDA
jgi:tetratricopeptide (TPR) repeat protein